MPPVSSTSAVAVRILQVFKLHVDVSCLYVLCVRLTVLRLGGNTMAMSLFIFSWNLGECCLFVSLHLCAEAGISLFLFSGTSLIHALFCFYLRKSGSFQDTTTKVSFCSRVAIGVSPFNYIAGVTCLLCKERITNTHKEVFAFTD